MRPKHKKMLKMAKGYRGRAKSCFKTAKNRVQKAMQYSYRDRKVRKRDFRRLWTQQVNAGARLHGLRYSELISAMPYAGISLSRRSLSELARTEPLSFRAVVETVRLGGGLEAMLAQREAAAAANAERVQQARLAAEKGGSAAYSMTEEQAARLAEIEAEVRKTEADRKAAELRGKVEAMREFISHPFTGAPWQEDDEQPSSSSADEERR